jgi:hypothetical protein
MRRLRNASLARGEGSGWKRRTTTATLVLVGTVAAAVLAAEVHAPHGVAPSEARRRPPEASAVTAAPHAPQAQTKLHLLRIPFVENQGQHDARVAYSANTFAGTVFVTRDGGLVHSFPGAPEPPEGDEPSALAGALAKSAKARPGWTLVETFDQAKPLAPRGADAAPARVNRFVGKDPAKWQRAMSTYNRVELGEAWDGIDVALQAHGNNVEKLFTVQPGADASRIRVRLAGAEALRLREDGGLAATTPDGEIAFTPPVAFQERDGRRESVQVAYVLDGDRYRFRLGPHDPSAPVVIDPLLQSTYLGGSGFDFDTGGRSLAIHPVNGDVYVVGTANSVDFPGTVGGAQPVDPFDEDWVVARLSADLTSLLQSTYLGGERVDYGYSVAVHPLSGEVYVAGSTTSTDFPGTAAGAQPAFAGEAFSTNFDFAVARLSADLTSLIQATYLGGDGDDSGPHLAIYPLESVAPGVVVVAGISTSTDFIGTTGGAQASNAGDRDCVLARLSAGLTSLRQSTYLGGTGEDFCFDLAIHPESSDIYVAGTSNSIDFPGATGGAQATNAGSYDSIVSRLSSGLITLPQSTYLGGSQVDRALAVTIHPGSGEVYVAGAIGSFDFPGVAGGAQETKAVGFDGAVTRLNAALTTLLQSSYLGGNGLDFALGLAIHPVSGEVYVSGLTESTDLPGTDGGAQPANAGGSDYLLARLDTTLTTLLRSTYLGGEGGDDASALAIHPVSGEIYVLGESFSTNFPGTDGGAQETNAGSTDAAVARLSADLAAETDPDDDNDGVLDGADNCPLDANPQQEDNDADGLGDACDADDDDDGILDETDNCPLAPNADQTDTDGDQIGYACDEDTDGDGIPDDSDPDVVADVVIDLPDDVFHSLGNKNAFLSRLDGIEQLILAGKLDQAILELQSLRKRVDGCGSKAANDDWITDCTSQLEIRTLLDELIANLSS